MKVIFLDIDGVLNDHHFNKEAMSGSIDTNCVKQFNRILKETNAKVVLSSAWRYMIHSTDTHSSAMTTKGFEYLLRTHGVSELVDIVGITELDDSNLGANRGQQILNWLNLRSEPIESYVVIDDNDLEISKYNHPFIHTDSSTGLTEEDADKAIRILNKNELNI